MTNDVGGEFFERELDMVAGRGVDLALVEEAMQRARAVGEAEKRSRKTDYVR
jgi:hypothetical protein